MKRPFLLMGMAALLAMTSCSSFDEPVAMDGEGTPLSRAGSRSIPVTSEEDLRNAVEFGEEEITIASSFSLSQDLELSYPVVINGMEGKTLTTTASLICTSDVTFNNLTIDATTPRGTGAITLNAENISVVLKGVNLTQHTAGTTDDSTYEGLAIKNVTCNNSLRLENTNIVLPGNYVRAINMYTPKASSVELEILNSHITCGTDLSMPSTYARVLSFSGVSCDNLVIDNSTLEGAYYVVNVNGSSKVTANVKNNSVLDGRAGFNIWSTNFTANVDNSKIIGRNNYPGPTETFANIVINQGAEYGTLNLNNVTFEMDVQKDNGTNYQYAVSFRASNQTMVADGTITVIDSEHNGVTSFVSANQGVVNLDITKGPNYKFVGINTGNKIFM